MAEPLVRNISDTARWAAVHRANESERPDAVFHDPFARRLAGERGEQIQKTLEPGNKNSWAWVARTVVYDRLITEQIKQGADMVVNLAAGLDARPYRMMLPASLQWIEVDLPGILDYKEEILGKEQPRCNLERIRLDLADVEERRKLFAQLGRRSKRALIVTEGLLIYLSEEEIGALATDLAAQPSFQHWIIDIASPGLLQMMQKQTGTKMQEAGAGFKFGPKAGPAFFSSFGWKPASVNSLLKTAAQVKRLSLMFRLLALLPESNGEQGNRPWSAVCLMERKKS
ncbi:MAG: class I SAM-dependent methyltransferase [Acidobacteria bacterium]|nr:class I SAM-dependent methyltransferase [Acidobacteriota bacterium]